MTSRRSTPALAAALLVSLSIGVLATPAAAGGRSEGAITGLGDGVTVTRHHTTGQVSFLSGTAARPVASAVSLGRPSSPHVAAQTFLGRYASLFGVADPLRDLRAAGSARVGRRTFVRYQQAYRGIPVIAGELIVQVGRGNDIISVNGETSPDLSLSVRPEIGAAQARRLAIAATAKHEKVKTASLRAGDATLAIYDAGLAGDPRALPGGRLAWRVDVTSRNRLIDEFVAIEATRGVVLATFNQVAQGAPPADATQRVCDLAGARATGGEGATDALQCDPGDPTLVANPAGSLVDDVVVAFLGAEATYDFFAKHFGRDSLDDAGLPLISTVRFCPESVAVACPFLNAFWNGTQMYYGLGYIADDIVGHELTHGFTSSTSNLLYWFQSGAINESLSDIFSEFVDFENGLGDDSAGVRWLHGEDNSLGANRDLKNPPLSPQGPQPDRMRSPDYYLDAGLTDNGGVHVNSGVGNKAAYLMTDGGTFNGQTITGVGVDRAAAIWYRAAARLLTSGSDYSDLAAALRQSCVDLKGTTPLDKNGAPSASGAITSATCTQVGRVITATEMSKDAIVATVKHAKLCKTGKPTTAPLFDRISSTGAPWLVFGSPNVWYVGDWFATSGDYALWATDTRSSSNASIRSKAIKIPATGRTYLAFRHYDNFQTWVSSLGGGVVEYATAASGPWRDLGSRFTFNGYNGTLQSGVGNPLQGRRAFVRMNHGFAVTKAELTFLKGKTIYLRFRIGTNNDTVGFDGWVLDDVRVYRCV